MDQPISISRYIGLSTKDPIETETLKCWFHCVRENAPSGTVMSVPSVDGEGKPRAVALVQRETEEGHSYIIPLTRDLNENEADLIVRAFAANNPDLDFDIQVSAPMADRMEQEQADIVVDHDKYLGLCTAWAKRQHDAWMKERSEQGWRYGVNFSLKDKTHPLLRPWDQLPTKFQKLDTEAPQMLLDLLNDQGYAIISRGELESLMKLMRSFS